MPSAARLTVTRGPDRGREFDISADLSHIGSDNNNQVALTDPLVSRHQASIVQRSGRFALFTPFDRTVLVDGAEVPADRWVWLPSDAEIRLGGETIVRFETQSLTMTAAAVSALPPRATPVETPAVVATPARKDESSSTVRRRRKKTDTRRTAAKLSLDAHGEPRVQLGADGRLPALNLTESASATAQPSGETAPRPWLVIVAALASAALSAALLLWTPASSESKSRSAARQELGAFFGEEGTELEPYQRFLRQAVVEHSQGRLREERRFYLRVLDLLNSADVRDPRNLHGLTGRQTSRGRNSDRELRELLEQLVAVP